LTGDPREIFLDLDPYRDILV
jgi:DNA-binding transcriptional regulator GbsR (MarR family)